MNLGKKIVYLAYIRKKQKTKTKQKEVIRQ